MCARQIELHEGALSPEVVAELKPLLTPQEFQTVQAPAAAAPVAGPCPHAHGTHMPRCDVAENEKEPGRSHRHVGAIAEHLLKDLKAAGAGSATVEGLNICDWVLIDAGDVIVHIFRPEVRGFYNLEKMWAPEEDAAPHYIG